MTEAPSTNPLLDLKGYLSACQKSYEKCIDVVAHQHSIAGLEATIRLHHLKFDGNGRPMISALAETLYGHIIDYCLAVQHRTTPLTSIESAKLTKEARKLFIHPTNTPANPDTTGEAGEVLLYFLLESVLGVPQVVAKMELKTNPNDELKGSDGIHMCWNEQDKLVDLFFGEAKLYQDVGGAITSALKSIATFHDNGMHQHEFSMVTKYFKYADANVKTAVTQLFEFGAPTGEIRINHACLIGYDWQEYGSLPKLATPALTEEFKKRYLADSQRLHEHLQKRFDTFQKKHLRFEVFFIPFPTVQEFRDAFNKALD
ncbi:MAG: DUF1837 domain-containing protein [Sideroxydans sp.]|nr:DUF1837 domain-containing protein [Sideroxydans sp.]